EALAEIAIRQNGGRGVVENPKEGIGAGLVRQGGRRSGPKNRPAGRGGGFPAGGAGKGTHQLGPGTVEGQGEFAFCRRFLEILEHSAICRIHGGGGFALQRGVWIVVPTDADGRLRLEELQGSIGNPCGPLADGGDVVENPETAAEGGS